MRKYDYSQVRAYFITICTELKKPYLGKVVDDSVVLSEIGEIVRECWSEIPEHYPHVDIEDFVIMPNHIHGIIRITEQIEETVERFGKPSKSSVSSVIRSFKAEVTRRVNKLQSQKIKVWQRSYWERIVRDDEEMYNIREYIRLNPAKWKEDRLQPPGFDSKPL